MPHKLKAVKIRRLALTRNGANKVRSQIFKSENFGEIFVNLSDEEKEILKNKKPENLAKADFLLEVADISEQLRKGELTTDDAADFLDDTIIKHEKDIPIKNSKSDHVKVTSLDELRNIVK